MSWSSLGIKTTNRNKLQNNTQTNSLFDLPNPTERANFSAMSQSSSSTVRRSKRIQENQRKLIKNRNKMDSDSSSNTDLDSNFSTSHDSKSNSNSFSSPEFNCFLLFCTHYVQIFNLKNK